LKLRRVIVGVGSILVITGVLLGALHFACMHA